MNIGEEICGEWLRHVRGCQFVQYNVKTTLVQGEIDVIGIDLDRRLVFACEVAVHLVTGLKYKDNVATVFAKFEKDAAYLRDKFPDYAHRFMFWSPVVKNGQLADLEEVHRQFRERCGQTVEPIVNDAFAAALRNLRAVARRETKEQTSSVMRYLQIEEHLAKHLQPDALLESAKGRRDDPCPTTSTPT